MKHLLTILLSCISVSAAWAVEPSAIISGPTVAKTGTLVVLSSAGSVSDPGGLAWVFIDGKTQALEGVNNELGFVQGEEGRVQVALLAIGTVDGKPKVSLAKWAVDITNSPAPTPPSPNPIPNPTPPNPTPPNPTPPAPTPPTPDLPDGRFKLARFVYGEANKLPAQARTLCPALAANFDSVATAAAAGSLTTPAAMSDEVLKRNLQSEGNLKDVLKPLFTALQSQLQTLSGSGSLKTTQDHIDAWREVAQGLKQVPVK